MEEPAGQLKSMTMQRLVESCLGTEFNGDKATGHEKGFAPK